MIVENKFLRMTWSEQMRLAQIYGENPMGNLRKIRELEAKKTEMERKIENLELRVEVNNVVKGWLEELGPKGDFRVLVAKIEAEIKRLRSVDADRSKEFKNVLREVKRRMR